MIDKELIKRRVGAVRAAMRKKQINYLLLVKAANVTYVTGFSGPRQLGSNHNE